MLQTAVLVQNGAWSEFRITFFRFFKTIEINLLFLFMEQNGKLTSLLHLQLSFGLLQDGLDGLV